MSGQYGLKHGRTLRAAASPEDFQSSGLDGLFPEELSPSTVCYTATSTRFDHSRTSVLRALHGADAQLFFPLLTATFLRTWQLTLKTPGSASFQMRV